MITYLADVDEILEGGDANFGLVSFLDIYMHFNNFISVRKVKFKSHLIRRNSLNTFHITKAMNVKKIYDQSHSVGADHECYRNSFRP